MPKLSSLLRFGGRLFGWFWQPPLPEERLFSLVSSSTPLPPDAKPIDSYKLSNGVSVQVGVTPRGKGLYYVQEPPLDEAELRVFRKIMSHLSYEMPFEVSHHGIRLSQEELTAEIQAATSRIVDTYRAGLKAMYRLATPKILYYVTRDVSGYGPVDPFFRDPLLEDLKSEGYGTPFIIVNRKWSELRWMETNVQLAPDEQDALALRLAHMGGRGLSTAFPVAEAMLPGRHRLMAVYGREVSPKGTAINVRLFQAEPWTIVYLARTRMLSPLMVAYLWMIIESRGSILIVGETGSGKTTLTSALGALIHPAMSIVTIEDIPELKLPHEHWLPLVTRFSYTVEAGETGRRGKRAGEIDQFDLLRVALRVRPDFITVGEVIGEEAQTLFQAVAVGQGTNTTLHAYDVLSAFRRLTTPPINTAPSLASALDCMVTVRRLKMATEPVEEGTQLGGEKKSVFERRVTEVHETVGTDPASVGKFSLIFRWDPRSDWFMPGTAAEVAQRSRVLMKYADRQGVTRDEVTADLEEKTALITSLAQHGAEKFDVVVDEVWKYYAAKLPPLQVRPLLVAPSIFDEFVRKLEER